VREELEKIKSPKNFPRQDNQTKPTREYIGEKKEKRDMVNTFSSFPQSRDFISKEKKKKRVLTFESLKEPRLSVCPCVTVLFGQKLLLFWLAFFF
jgi:hypothetical protein